MTRFLLHNLTLTVEEETSYIGVWGQRRLNYLKHHRKVLYYNLLTSGKLHSHLANTEEQAQQLFLRLVKDFAKKENVTEKLKYLLFHEAKVHNKKLVILDKEFMLHLLDKYLTDKSL